MPDLQPKTPEKRLEELEAGMFRVLGEFQQATARLVVLSARVERLESAVNKHWIP